MAISLSDSFFFFFYWSLWYQSRCINLLFLQLPANANKAKEDKHGVVTLGAGLAEIAGGDKTKLGWTVKRELYWELSKKRGAGRMWVHDES